jgi:diacylglycerol kinase (ATP)
VITTAAILANPIAGRGKGKFTAKLLYRTLQGAGIETTLIFDDPRKASADVLLSAEAVIAVGGDGTLRAVASRCLEVRGNIAPLLPVPMGTANLMGRHLGIDWQAADLAERVLKSIQRNRVNLLDTATANGELFLLCAGAGLDGMLIHEMDRVRRGPIQYMNYILPAALTLAGYTYSPIRVAIDGSEVFALAPGIAVVANISEYGTGFPVAPDAVPNDGLLDVLVLPVGSVGEAIEKFMHAVAGEHLLAEGAIYERGKSIEIDSTGQVPVQLDGDAAGHTPVRIDLLPVRAPFIVPV